MTTDRPDLPTFDGHNVIEHAAHAAEAMRAINHITGWPTGLTYPSDAYTVLGELAAFVARLPQALRQIEARLLRWHADGHIGIDRGTEFGGRPASAVAEATNALQRARYSSADLFLSLDTAGQAVGNAHWTGPDTETDPGTGQ
jgi:hypothetical protein